MLDKTLLKIIPLPALKDNYIWLLKNKASRHVAIVDPSEAKPVLDRIKTERLIPTAIMITHHHWDHVGGIAAIIEQFNIPVYTPKSETIAGSTHPVGAGDVVSLPELGLQLNILDVPGHTAGAVAYYNDDLVFSGDTLFTAGCGRLFEGTPAQMHNSLSKFKALPDNTRLYCGHEYTVSNLKFAAHLEPGNKAIQQRLQRATATRDKHLPTVPATMSEEQATNPFLRCEEVTVIAAARAYATTSATAPADVFATIRRWKDNF